MIPGPLLQDLMWSKKIEMLSQEMHPKKILKHFLPQHMSISESPSITFSSTIEKISMPPLPRSHIHGFLHWHSAQFIFRYCKPTEEKAARNLFNAFFTEFTREKKYPSSLPSAIRETHEKLTFNERKQLCSVGKTISTPRPPKQVLKWFHNAFARLDFQ